MLHTADIRSLSFSPCDGFFQLFPFKHAVKKLEAVLAAARDGLATLRSTQGCTGGRAVQWVC